MRRCGAADPEVRTQQFYTFAEDPAVVHGEGPIAYSGCEAPQLSEGCHGSGEPLFTYDKQGTRSKTRESGRSLPLRQHLLGSFAER